MRNSMQFRHSSLDGIRVGDVVRSLSHLSNYEAFGVVCHIINDPGDQDFRRDGAKVHCACWEGNERDAIESYNSNYGPGLMPLLNRCSFMPLKTCTVVKAYRCGSGRGLC